MTKRNNKGFSLIELLVVIAIIGVAGTIAATSLSSAYHARSYKAAKTIAGLISESKVDAMSGKKNMLMLWYNESDKCYNAYILSAVRKSDGTYLKDSSGNYYYDESGIYEYYDDIGNNELQISVPASGSSFPLIDSNEECNGIFFLDFNMDTGALKTMAVFDGGDSIEDVIDMSTGYVCIKASNIDHNCLSGSPSSVTISLSSYTNHSITIYRSTGNVEFK